MDRNVPMGRICVWISVWSMDDESDDRGIGGQLCAVLWPRHLAGREARPSAYAFSCAYAAGAAADCACLPHVRNNERRCAAYAVSVLLEMRRGQLLLPGSFAQS